MVRLAAPAGEELAGMNGGILRALPIPSPIGMQDGHAQVLSDAVVSNRKKAPGRCNTTAWGLAIFIFCRMTRRRSEREQVQSRVRVVRSVHRAGNDLYDHFAGGADHRPI